MRWERIKEMVNDRERGGVMTHLTIHQCGQVCILHNILVVYAGDLFYILLS